MAVHNACQTTKGRLCSLPHLTALTEVGLDWWNCNFLLLSWEIGRLVTYRCMKGDTTVAKLTRECMSLIHGTWKFQEDGWHDTKQHKAHSQYWFTRSVCPLVWGWQPDDKLTATAQDLTEGLPDWVGQLWTSISDDILEHVENQKIRSLWRKENIGRDGMYCLGKTVNYGQTSVTVWGRKSSVKDHSHVRPWTTGNKKGVQQASRGLMDGHADTKAQVSLDTELSVQLKAGWQENL